MSSDAEKLVLLVKPYVASAALLLVVVKVIASGAGNEFGGEA